MEKKYRERLEQVCRVLRDLPAGKKFSLESWYRCGTIGCAIGWAAADPWFTRRGLKLISHSFFIPNEKVPFYKGVRDISAVEKFFGLAQHNVTWIFYGEGYKQGSRRNVIRRIEKFIKDAA